MNDETGDEAVKDSVVVIAIEAELEEVTGGDGRLFGEEVEEDIAGRSGEENLSGGLRLEVVKGTHGEGALWASADKGSLGVFERHNCI